MPNFPFAHYGLMGYIKYMTAIKETRQADERGRISLGTSFANCVFLVENEGDAIIIRPARVIPEREAWLYENKRALASVRKGLDQVKKGQFARPPSLDSARDLLDEAD